MRGEPNTYAKIRPLSDLDPGGNTAAVITIAAVEERSHSILWIHYSYTAAPTGGSLTISAAGVDIYKINIGGIVSKPLRFDPGGLNAGENEEVVITLAAGGGGIVGQLNAGVR